MIGTATGQRTRSSQYQTCPRPYSNQRFHLVVQDLVTLANLVLTCRLVTQDSEHSHESTTAGHLQGISAVGGVALASAAAPQVAHGRRRARNAIALCQSVRRTRHDKCQISISRNSSADFTSHVPNFDILFGVRFFCFGCSVLLLSGNKQNLATLSGTGKGLKAMAKTLRIFLVPKTFPKRFHTKNPSEEVCSWWKSTATPFVLSLGPRVPSNLEIAFERPCTRCFIRRD